MTALSNPGCSNKKFAIVSGFPSAMNPSLVKYTRPFFGLKLNCLIPSCRAVLRCFKFSNSKGSSTSSGKLEVIGEDNWRAEPFVLDLFLVAANQLEDLASDVNPF
ncbi:hypothetical protein WICMUC_001943 [Wickerhamomyces mucosus]|uniref:Uncharacterized protein n=1 Tax=Wickerhamomyces mucosus TaxID=1378264 RepID=A0A9P8PSY3_9ASCO|nr:hypothetical protein WICMUC_001943 [Wickerhamomyces mucosus]